MRIIITLDLPDEYSDIGHQSGMTEECYDEFMHTLKDLGTNIIIVGFKETPNGRSC